MTDTPIAEWMKDACDDVLSHLDGRKGFDFQALDADIVADILAELRSIIAAHAPADQSVELARLQDQLSRVTDGSVSVCGHDIPVVKPIANMVFAHKVTCALGLDSPGVISVSETKMIAAIKDQSAELERVTKQLASLPHTGDGHLLRANMKAYYVDPTGYVQGIDVGYHAKHTDASIPSVLHCPAYFLFVDPEKARAAGECPPKPANAAPETKPVGLEWTDTDDGWEAASAFNFAGSPFMWRVELHAAAFWVSNSDEELVDHDTAMSMDFGYDEIGAKAWCQDRENEQLKVDDDE